MCAGGATTTVYPSTNAPDVAYILTDSGSQIVVVEDAAQLGKLLAHRDELAAVRKVVLVSPDGVDLGAGRDPWLLTLEELAGAGRELRSSRALGRRRCDSGRGARAPRHPDLHLGHHRPAQGCRAHARTAGLRGGCIDGLGLLRPDDLQFLWLPLSHSFGKVLEVGAAADRVHHRRRRPGGQDRREPRPRQADVHGRRARASSRRCYTRVVRRREEGGGLKASIFEWAFGVGAEVVAARRAARQPGRAARPAARARRQVGVLQAQAAVGRPDRYFVSGSAALSRDVAELFHAAGIADPRGLRAHRDAARRRS